MRKKAIIRPTEVPPLRPPRTDLLAKKANPLDHGQLSTPAPKPGFPGLSGGKSKKTPPPMAGC